MGGIKILLMSSLACDIPGSFPTAVSKSIIFHFQGRYPLVD
jgi:hypothetical protein